MGWVDLRWFAAGLLLTTASVGWTEEASPTQRLLEAGWEKGIAAQKAAAEIYDQAAIGTPDDVALHYSHALVQLKHRRYREAETLLKAVLSRQDNHPGARGAMLWTSALRKKYSETLAQAESWSEELGKASSPDRNERVEFVGRIFGFLQGPAAKSVAAANATDVRTRILARLDEEGKKAFQTGEEDVLRQYAMLSGQSDATREQSKAAEETQLIEQEQDLQREES
ncbi:MAG: hypothetical protein N2C14_10545, partial [Planctomycetales bacterium]